MLLVLLAGQLLLICAKPMDEHSRSSRQAPFAPGPAPGPGGVETGDRHLLGALFGHHHHHHGGLLGGHHGGLFGHHGLFGLGK